MSDVDETLIEAIEPNAKTVDWLDVVHNLKAKQRKRKQDSKILY